MATHMLSLESRRELINAQIDDLVEAGTFPERGVNAGGSGQSALGTRRYIATAGSSELDDIQRQLNAAEDDALAAERRQRLADRHRHTRVVPGLHLQQPRHVAYRAPHRTVAAEL